MMTESEMKQLLQQDGKKVEAALQELLPDDAISALQRISVVEAMRYSLEAGGKRIRPVLVLEFCKMFGGTEEQAMPAAAEKPWPREPAVKSTPGVLSISQWEGRLVPP